MNIISQKYEITHVKDVYEKIADEFNKTRAYYWKPVSSFINSLPKYSLIYDIGCGNGRNMNYPNYSFIGIDNCKKFITICKTKGYEAILSDMTKITLSDNSCDSIICIASFHHLSNRENRIKSLLEMKRLVKPDGLILLTVWSKNQPKKTRVTFESYGDNIVYWKNKYARYYYIFTLDEIKSLFNECGLLIKNHIYDCGNEVFILQKKN